MDKNIIEKYLFRGDDTACGYCKYNLFDDCPKAVKCYGDQPIFPPCSENFNYEEYMDYESAQETLEEEIYNFFDGINIKVKNITIENNKIIIEVENGKNKTCGNS